MSLPVTPTAIERLVAAAAARMPGVLAVSLGGSRATGHADAASDSDLYCWTGSDPARGVALGAPGEPTQDQRRAAFTPLADDGALRHDDAWGPCDHLLVEGHQFEVMYFDLDAILADHARASAEGARDEAFFGALMHTVARSVPLVDDAGLLADAKVRLTEYPEATRTRLIRELPNVMDEYLRQLTDAQRRGDWPMLLHKRASAQAVHANLLFALNRTYHPGEKRLLLHVAGLPVLPEGHLARWEAVVRMAPDDPALVPGIAALWRELLDTAMSRHDEG